MNQPAIILRSISPAYVLATGALYSRFSALCDLRDRQGHASPKYVALQRRVERAASQFREAATDHAKSGGSRNATL